MKTNTPFHERLFLKESSFGKKILQSYLIFILSIFSPLLSSQASFNEPLTQDNSQVLLYLANTPEEILHPKSDHYFFLDGKSLLHFLNNVADKGDPLYLFNPNIYLGNGFSHLTRSQEQQGSSYSYHYYFSGNNTNEEALAVKNITLKQLMAYCNWCWNQQPHDIEGPSTTDKGIYDLSENRDTSSEESNISKKDLFSDKSQSNTGFCYLCDPEGNILTSNEEVEAGYSTQTPSSNPSPVTASSTPAYQKEEPYPNIPTLPLYDTPNIPATCFMGSGGGNSSQNNNSEILPYSAAIGGGLLAIGGVVGYFFRGRPPVMITTQPNMRSLARGEESPFYKELLSPETPGNLTPSNSSFKVLEKNRADIERERLIFSSEKNRYAPYACPIKVLPHSSLELHPKEIIALRREYYPTIREATSSEEEESGNDPSNKKKETPKKEDLSGKALKELTSNSSATTLGTQEKTDEESDEERSLSNSQESVAHQQGQDDYSVNSEGERNRILNHLYQKYRNQPGRRIDESIARNHKEDTLNTSEEDNLEKANQILHDIEFSKRARKEQRGKEVINYYLLKLTEQDHEEYLCLQALQNAKKQLTTFQDFLKSTPSNALLQKDQEYPSLLQQNPAIQDFLNLQGLGPESITNSHELRMLVQDYLESDNSILHSLCLHLSQGNEGVEEESSLEGTTLPEKFQRFLSRVYEQRQAEEFFNQIESKCEQLEKIYKEELNVEEELLNNQYKATSGAILENLRDTVATLANPIEILQSEIEFLQDPQKAANKALLRTTFPTVEVTSTITNIPIIPAEIPLDLRSIFEALNEKLSVTSTLLAEAKRIREQQHQILLKKRDKEIKELLKNPPPRERLKINQALTEVAPDFLLIEQLGRASFSSPLLSSSGPTLEDSLTQCYSLEKRRLQMEYFQKKQITAKTIEETLIRRGTLSTLAQQLLFSSQPSLDTSRALTKWVDYLAWLHSPSTRELMNSLSYPKALKIREDTKRRNDYFQKLRKQHYSPETVMVRVGKKIISLVDERIRALKHLATLSQKVPQLLQLRLQGYSQQVEAMKLLYEKKKLTPKPGHLLREKKKKVATLCQKIGKKIESSQSKLNNTIKAHPKKEADLIKGFHKLQREQEQLQQKQQLHQKLKRLKEGFIFWQQELEESRQEEMENLCDTLIRGTDPSCQTSLNVISKSFSQLSTLIMENYRSPLIVSLLETTSKLFQPGYKKNAHEYLEEIKKLLLLKIFSKNMRFYVEHSSSPNAKVEVKKNWNRFIDILQKQRQTELSQEMQGKAVTAITKFLESGEDDLITHHLLALEEESTIPLLIKYLIDYCQNPTFFQESQALSQIKLMREDLRSFSEDLQPQQIKEKKNNLEKLLEKHYYCNGAILAAKEAIFNALEKQQIDNAQKALDTLQELLIKQAETPVHQVKKELERLLTKNHHDDNISSEKKNLFTALESSQFEAAKEALYTIQNYLLKIRENLEKPIESYPQENSAGYAPMVSSLNSSEKEEEESKKASNTVPTALEEAKLIDLKELLKGRYPFALEDQKTFQAKIKEALEPKKENYATAQYYLKEMEQRKVLAQKGSINPPLLGWKKECHQLQQAIRNKSPQQGTAAIERLEKTLLELPIQTSLRDQIEDLTKKAKLLEVKCNRIQRTEINLTERPNFLESNKNIHIFLNEEMQRIQKLKTSLEEECQRVKQKEPESKKIQQLIQQKQQEIQQDHQKLQEASQELQKEQQKKEKYQETEQRCTQEIEALLLPFEEVDEYTPPENQEKKLSTLINKAYREITSLQQKNGKKVLQEINYPHITSLYLRPLFEGIQELHQYYDEYYRLKKQLQEVELEEEMSIKHSSSSSTPRITKEELEVKIDTLKEKIKNVIPSINKSILERIDNILLNKEIIIKNMKVWIEQYYKNQTQEITKKRITGEEITEEEIIEQERVKKELNEVNLFMDAFFNELETSKEHASTKVDEETTKDWDEFFVKQKNKFLKGKTLTIRQKELFDLFLKEANYYNYLSPKLVKIKSIDPINITINKDFIFYKVFHHISFERKKKEKEKMDRELPAYRNLLLPDLIGQYKGYLKLLKKALSLPVSLPKTSATPVKKSGSPIITRNEAIEEGLKEGSTPTEITQWISTLPPFISSYMQEKYNSYLKNGEKLEHLNFDTIEEVKELAQKALIPSEKWKEIRKSPDSIAASLNELYELAGKSGSALARNITNELEEKDVFLDTGVLTDEFHSISNCMIRSSTNLSDLVQNGPSSAREKYERELKKQKAAALEAFQMEYALKRQKSLKEVTERAQQLEKESQQKTRERKRERSEERLKQMRKELEAKNKFAAKLQSQIDAYTASIERKKRNSTISETYGGKEIQPTPEWEHILETETQRLGSLESIKRKVDQEREALDQKITEDGEDGEDDRELQITTPYYLQMNHHQELLPHPHTANYWEEEDNDSLSPYDYSTTSDQVSSLYGQKTGAPQLIPQATQATIVNESSRNWCDWNALINSDDFLLPSSFKEYLEDPRANLRKQLYEKGTLSTTQNYAHRRTLKKLAISQESQMDFTSGTLPSRQLDRNLWNPLFGEKGTLRSLSDRSATTDLSSSTVKVPSIQWLEEPQSNIPKGASPQSELEIVSKLAPEGIRRLRRIIFKDPEEEGSDSEKDKVIDCLELKTAEEKEKRSQESFQVNQFIPYQLSNKMSRSSLISGPSPISRSIYNNSISLLSSNKSDSIIIPTTGNGSTGKNTLHQGLFPFSTGQDKDSPTDYFLGTETSYNESSPFSNGWDHLRNSDPNSSSIFCSSFNSSGMTSHESSNTNSKETSRSATPERTKETTSLENAFAIQQLQRLLPQESPQKIQELIKVAQEKSPREILTQEEAPDFGTYVLLKNYMGSKLLTTFHPSEEDKIKQELDQGFAKGILILRHRADLKTQATQRDLLRNYICRSTEYLLVKEFLLSNQILLKLYQKTGSPGSTNQLPPTEWIKELLDQMRPNPLRQVSTNVSQTPIPFPHQLEKTQKIEVLTLLNNLYQHLVIIQYLDNTLNNAPNSQRNILFQELSPFVENIDKGPKQRVSRAPFEEILQLLSRSLPSKPTTIIKFPEKAASIPISTPTVGIPPLYPNQSSSCPSGSGLMESYMIPEELLGTPGNSLFQKKIEKAQNHLNEIEGSLIGINEYGLPRIRSQWIPRTSEASNSSK